MKPTGTESNSDLNNDQTELSSPSRRTWLKGASLGGAVALGGLGTVAVLQQTGKLPKPGQSAMGDTTKENQPFYGEHQAGIITPQPAAALVVVFDVLAKDKHELTRLFKLLTTRISFLTKGGKVPDVDPKLPPLDSGVLGPEVFPDNLTVTISVGASLFDQRFGLADKKPAHLIEMVRFPNDQLNLDECHGDLSIQICSNTAETNIHALRDIIKHTPDLLAVKWKIDGFLPPHTLAKMGEESVINLLGFKDGTANPNAQDNKLMDELVWVGTQSGEPAWTVGGSYQVVRIIRNLVEQWDRTPLQEQEKIFGRHKHSGAPLGKKNEHDDPDYASDSDGSRIDFKSHIRLANPRTAETRKNLILRRGFNYSRGISKSGQLDMGLLFVCYQANLTNGFLTVQARLNGEPLEEYIRPVGGGYFFSLPGVKDEKEFLGQALLA
ncbi:deferrochelatase/peroxidase EfeB [Leeia sp. TBRC 13508]|uniref:Deferrochelatase n=1 Tax=Leeia speluncae TaxID=2884804 RepID=A0ABS8DAF9_9NEIS|nr:iron uptake transporter deferrochelatase/peroxidase subunit [Leeia speluncae]MCB6185190.1 deferrochelatase/peroxidase EfeB [Leeia speluncae]